jgi:hypothetical protein
MHGTRLAKIETQIETLSRRLREVEDRVGALELRATEVAPTAAPGEGAG